MSANVYLNGAKIAYFAVFLKLFQVFILRLWNFNAELPKICRKSEYNAVSIFNDDISEIVNIHIFNMGQLCC